MQEEDRDLLALLEKVRRERGLDCRQYKINFLKRRLAVRLRARGVESYREYMRLLDEEEYEKLFEALTINLSYFFRDGTTFEALRDKVLRPLLREKAERGSRLIRVWSAGCAGGEEPYSVAILFHELLGGELKNWRVHILATDLDARALEKAKRGVYGEFSFRGMDPKYLRRYFVPLPQGEYAIKPQVVALVKFERRDLIADPPPRRLDLILCRNVLIYFTREQQEKLLHKFHHALNEGGYLLIGKTEVLMGTAARLFKPLDPKERIYIKAPI
ncbi:MAG TPA: protein-glutamate O-methyltransferase CheR [Anaerolineae bacterium]|nr:protein-glutamate O-methyltransferase CheR [Anaerolineae bacterium]